MTPPDDRLAALLDAHRRVRRPPPGLQARIAAALAEEEIAEPVAPPRSRWVESIAISVALAAAALLLLHWLAGPRTDRAGATDESNPRDQAVFGAKTPDTAGKAETRAPATPPTPPPTQPPDPEVDTSPPPAPTTADPTPPPRRDSARTAPAPEHDDAKLEVRMLRDAEVALAKDPADALRQLKVHATRFPDSTLAVERQALWTLAACATAASDAAPRRDAFLASHPGSAYAARIRAACPR